VAVDSSAFALTLSARPSRAASGFLRGTAFLKSLQSAALVRLETLAAGSALRVWVPQCAAGEDAYSVAICLFETFGARWREIPLYVFSTDLDTEALSRARTGRYLSEAARRISRERLGRFFESEQGRIRVRSFVRKACRFVSLHPSQTPPFSRLDLIVARDTLSSLSPAARRDALRVFHSVLAPGGILLDESAAAAETPELFVAQRRGRSYAARKAAAEAFHRGDAEVSSFVARLRESEEKLGFLLQKTGEAFLVLDADTGLILEANAGAQKLFGFEPAELLGLSRSRLLAPAALVRRGRDERRSPERLALPHFRRKDGTIFPADSSKTFLMLKGRPCSLWMLRDATNRLRAAAGIQVDRVRDEFIGEVVHELRSPISVIRGSVETLRKGVRGTRERSSFLRFIENQAGRMAGLVDQLLDLGAAERARPGAAPQTLLLSDTLREIVAAFAPVAKRRRISFKIDITDGVAVRAEPGDVPHIFGNLIDNALKFAPRGGTIFIRGRAEEGEGVVSVRDTGPGLASEDLSRVFERFFRAENARRTKGTGLGLAIVRRIVEANGGRVTAENDPAGGALFRVALPLAPEPSR
jgi:PAS domain S-box-containing protein